MNPQNELKMLISFDDEFWFDRFTLTFECSAHLMQRIIAYFFGPNPGLLEFSRLQFWAKHDWSLKNTSRLNKSSFYTYTLKPNGAAVYINSCALIVTRHKLKTWTSFILSHRSQWPKCIQMRRKKFRVSKPPCISLKTKTTASFYHLLDCLDFLSFFFFFLLCFTAWYYLGKWIGRIETRSQLFIREACWG